MNRVSNIRLLFLSTLVLFAFFINTTIALSASLGISISDSTSFPIGALVSRVSPGGLGDKAGFKSGDVLSMVSWGRFNIRPIMNAKNLVYAIQEIPEEEEVEFTFYRKDGFLWNMETTKIKIVSLPETKTYESTQQTQKEEQPVAEGQLQESKEEKQPQNVDINISVSSESQIFPFTVKLANDRQPPANIGLIVWKITNNSSAVVQVFTKTEIQEWCPPVMKQVQVGPGETKEVGVTPFGKKLLGNIETTSASLALEAKVGEKVIFQDTRTIQIHATEDMMWSHKKAYDWAVFIAGWLTPNDPYVEQVLSIAKERMLLSGRAFPGYHGNVLEQIKAIFYALRRNYKISYVNSPPDYAIGNVQRIRYPAQCLVDKSANCIEGAVLMASLFERIGLDPSIVLIPGHAFVGVKGAPDSPNSYFIETTMLGRSALKSVIEMQDTFDSAWKVASKEFEDSSRKGEVQIIDIKTARKIGINPMPVKFKGTKE